MKLMKTLINFNINFTNQIVDKLFVTEKQQRFVMLKFSTIKVKGKRLIHKNKSFYVKSASNFFLDLFSQQKVTVLLCLSCIHVWQMKNI